MTAIARRIFHLRRAVSDRWALLVLMGLWPLMALGRLSAASLLSGHLLPLAVLTMFGLTLLLVVLREVMPPAATPATTDATAAWAELELGLSFVTAVYVLIAATGGLESFAYPLVYALVSFLMVVHRVRLVALAWLVAAFGLEVLVGWPTIATAGWAPVAYHLTFIGFFAAGNLLVLSSLVRRLRHGHEVQVASALTQMHQEARDFRLITTQLPSASRARSRDAEEVRMAVAAVETIHEQLFHNVDLLRASLSLNTCALLWCEEDEGNTPRLTLKEVSTVSEAVRQNPQLDAPGLLASVLTAPKPLRLKALGGRRVPPYYDGPPHPAAVTDLCVVPLLDGPNLRGLLCADRSDDQPFTAEDEETLVKAATHMLRVVEQERVFTAVERSKYEQEQFYRASELLGEALTLSDVFEKTFASARLIAHYDLAVLTLADDAGSRHQVAAVDVGCSPDAEDDRASEPWDTLATALEGRTLSGDRSLVGMAVKNRHFMPASGGLVDGATVVFDAETRLAHAQSLLVLPLMRGDQVLGALTLVSSRARQYVPCTREMLRVICRQVAVSVDNARMYQAMEERATTDGLTGLTNHRAFQERMAQLHDLCERTDGHYSVILTDIDRFKNINDTYGHPVGDVVLKRVAAILSGQSRRVDIVARYGGEEFVLVLPDTDGEGAAIFANKLREEIEAQVMTSDHGSFKVTISMGVAEYPRDGDQRHGLIEKSDQALYHCKENGRNCVARWSQI